MKRKLWAILLCLTMLPSVALPVSAEETVTPSVTNLYTLDFENADTTKAVTATDAELFATWLPTGFNSAVMTIGSADGSSSDTHKYQVVSDAPSKTNDKALKFLSEVYTASNVERYLEMLSTETSKEEYTQDDFARISTGSNGAAVLSFDYYANGRPMFIKPGNALVQGADGIETVEKTDFIRIDADGYMRMFGAGDNVGPLIPVSDNKWHTIKVIMTSDNRYAVVVDGVIAVDLTETDYYGADFRGWKELRFYNNRHYTKKEDVEYYMDNISYDVIRDIDLTTSLYSFKHSSKNADKYFSINGTADPVIYAKSTTKVADFVKGLSANEFNMSSTPISILDADGTDISTDAEKTMADVKKISFVTDVFGIKKEFAVDTTTSIEEKVEVLNNGTTELATDDVSDAMRLVNAQLEATDSFGGKAAGDKAVKIVPIKEGAAALDTHGYIDYNLQRDTTALSKAHAPITLEYSMYASGTENERAVAGLEVSSASGNIAVLNMALGTGDVIDNDTKKTVASYVPNQWNRIAISVYPNSMTYDLYINGTKAYTKSVSADKASKYINRIRLRARYEDEADAVLFDDVKLIYGVYNYAQSAVKIETPTEKIQIRTNKANALRSVEGATVEDAVALAVANGYEEARLYTDATLSSEVTGEIAEGNVLVISGGDGMYGYYTFNNAADQSLALENISHSNAEINKYLSVNGVETPVVYAKGSVKVTDFVAGLSDEELGDKFTVTVLDAENNDISADTEKTMADAVKVQMSAIPVEKTKEFAVDTTTSIEEKVEVLNNGTTELATDDVSDAMRLVNAQLEATDSFGGKAAGDKAVKIVPIKEGAAALDTHGYIDYNLQRDTTALSKAYAPITLEYSMYASGTENERAVAGLEVSSASGNIAVLNMALGTGDVIDNDTKKTVASYVPNQWNRIAISVYPNSMKYDLFVNGTKVYTKSVSEDKASKYINRLRLRARYEDNADTVLIDDVKLTYGVYKYSQSAVVANKATDKIKIKTNEVNTLKSVEGATVEDATAFVTANGYADARLYTDATLAETVAGVIPDGAVLVISDGNGMYTYYTFNNAFDETLALEEISHSNAEINKYLSINGVEEPVMYAKGSVKVTDFAAGLSDKEIGKNIIVTVLDASGADITADTEKTMADASKVQISATVFEKTKEFPVVTATTTEEKVEVLNNGTTEIVADDVSDVMRLVKAKLEATDGFGGKSADDKSLKIIPLDSNDEVVLDGHGYIDYNLQRDTTALSKAHAPITLEYSMYASGTENARAVAGVEVAGASGNIAVLNMALGTGDVIDTATNKIVASYIPNQWNRIAISTYPNSMKYDLYINGIKVYTKPISADSASQYISRIRLRARYEDSADAVLFDDVKLTYGAYDYAQSAITLTTDTDQIRKNANGTLASETTATVDDAIAFAQGNGYTDARVYTDSSFAELAEGEIVDGNVLVISDANGMYGYFVFKNSFDEAAALEKISHSDNKIDKYLSINGIEEPVIYAKATVKVTEFAEGLSDDEIGKNIIVTVLDASGTDITSDTEKTMADASKVQISATVFEKTKEFPVVTTTSTEEKVEILNNGTTDIATDDVSDAVRLINSKVEAVNGFGGKSAEDKSLRIVPALDDEAVLDKHGYIDYNLKRDETALSKAYAPMTFEYSMYASGIENDRAVAGLEIGSATGDIAMVNMALGTGDVVDYATGEKVAVYNPDQWNRIAITVYPNSMTYDLYVNGTKVYTKAVAVDKASEYISRIRLRARYEDSADTVLFDDVKLTYGAYDYAHSAISVETDTDKIKIAENGVLTSASDATVADATDFATANGYTDARVYTDKMCTTEVTGAISTGNVLVVSDENGMYSYYTFNRQADQNTALENISHSNAEINKYLSINGVETPVVYARGTVKISDFIAGLSDEELGKNFTVAVIDASGVDISAEAGKTMADAAKVQVSAMSFEKTKEFTVVTTTSTEEKVNALNIGTTEIATDDVSDALRLDNANVEAVDGFAGRATGDKSLKIVPVTEDGTFGYIDYNLQRNETELSKAHAPMTFEYSMYANGAENAAAIFAVDGATENIATVNMTLDSGKVVDTATGEEVASYNVGKWNKVAITVYPNSMTYDLFVNGTKAYTKTVAEDKISNYISRIRLGAKYADGTDTVVFDDVKLTYGVYDYAQAVIAVNTDTDKIKINSDGTLSSGTVITAEDAVALVQANGYTDARVYTDATLTEVVTGTIADGNVLVISDGNGMYGYYTFKSSFSVSAALENVSHSDTEINKYLSINSVAEPVVYAKGTVKIADFIAGLSDEELDDKFTVTVLDANGNDITSDTEKTMADAAKVQLSATVVEKTKEFTVVTTTWAEEKVNVINDGTTQISTEDVNDAMRLTDSQVEAVDGFGGKAEGDKSLNIVPLKDGEAAFDTYGYIDYNLQRNETELSKAHAPMTFEYSMYASGVENAVAALEVDGATENIATVNMTLDSGKVIDTATGEEVASYNVGKWNRVAITVYPNSMTYDLFVNGTKAYTKTVTEDKASKYISRIRLGAKYADGTDTVVFDDVKLTYGVYDYAQAVVTVNTDTDKITINENGKLDFAKGSIAEDAVAFAQANGYADARVYTDMTLTEVVTGEILGESVLVISDGNGMYGYYTFNQPPEKYTVEITPVETEGGYTVTATATDNEETGSFAGAVMYVAKYADDMSLESVQVVYGVADEPNTLTTSINVTSLDTIKVFIWDATTQKPITEVKSLTK